MTRTTTGAARRRAPVVVAKTVAKTVRKVAMQAATAVAVLGMLCACVPAEPDAAPTPTGLATPRSVAPLAPLVIPAVLNYCPVEDAVHFSGYWLPIDEVYICRGDGKHATDGASSFGPWESAAQVDRPAALLKAYGAPDARVSNGLCSHLRRDPLIVWVHRDGVTTAYYAPVDGCGDPSAAATTAYDAATRTLLLDIDRGAPTVSTKDATG